MTEKTEAARLELKRRLEQAEMVLVGVGRGWQLDGAGGPQREQRLRAAYARLRQILQGKDFYLVTTVTDGLVYEAGFDAAQVAAPCGNLHWLQCSGACTKDIWEEGEITDGVCPHCGAPLTANTIEAEHYIEEGYLPRWEAYKRWQMRTVNRRLVLLELGEDFTAPTVMRWPFEKIVFFNHKAWLCRVGREFFQVPQEIGERALPVQADPLDFVSGL